MGLAAHSIESTAPEIGLSSPIYGVWKLRHALGRLTSSRARARRRVSGSWSIEGAEKPSVQVAGLIADLESGLLRRAGSTNRDAWSAGPARCGSRPGRWHSDRVGDCDADAAECGIHRI